MMSEQDQRELQALLRGDRGQLPLWELLQLLATGGVGHCLYCHKVQVDAHPARSECQVGRAIRLLRLAASEPAPERGSPCQQACRSLSP
jgi:hypothetical protein